MSKHIVQSVIFPKAHFTLEKAKEWLKKYHYNNSEEVDDKPNYFRFRQHSPSKKYKYYISHHERGIEFVIAYRPNKPS